MAHIIDDRFLDQFGRKGERHPPSRISPTRNRRDDGETIPFLQRGLQILIEPDILIVHIDIDKASQLSLFISKPLLKPRIGLCKPLDYLSNRFSLRPDDILLPCQFLQWGRYSNLNLHFFLPFAHPIWA